MIKKLILISIIPCVLILTGYFGYKKMYPQKERLGINVSFPEGIKTDSIIVDKSQRRMTLMNRRKEIKSYSISLGKNPSGHKIQEGDKKTPEGTYVIDKKNPNSKYHFSLRISYPNENDKSYAERIGVSPGGDIMVHGLPNNMNFIEDYYLNSDWTDGCIAVSNKEIEEIWTAVDEGTPITILP